MLVTFSASAMPHASHAQQKMIEYSSGTGFFVTRNGEVITNAHVVQDCLDKRGVEIRGGSTGTAEIKAMDKKLDLALLKSNARVNSIAPLRTTESAIKIGDKVMLLGYPLDASASGIYKVANATVTGLQGPLGEERWIQFSSSAQRGNSGGPLLDMGGNVIGVVTGKTQLVREDRFKRETVVQASDVAVALKLLKGFLDANRVYYNRADTIAQRTSNYLEQQAKHSIVNVRCKTGEKALP